MRSKQDLSFGGGEMKVKEVRKLFDDRTRSFFDSETFKRMVSPEYPIIIYIEPTNDCNLRCSICPRRDGAREIGYMGFDFYKKVVDEIAEIGKVLILNLFKDGESLLHPKLVDMIRYARNKLPNIFMNMNTNGVFLRGGKAVEIANSGLDYLTISLNAMDKETYLDSHGIDLYDRIVENIENFMLTKKEKPHVRVINVLPKSDLKTRSDFSEKWKDAVDEVGMPILHNYGGGCRDFILDGEQDRYPCLFFWQMLAVNWNGVVSPCCVDYALSFDLGNLHNDSLIDIWKGEKLRHYRRAHLNNDFSDCQFCNTWRVGPNMKDWLKDQKDFLHVSGRAGGEGRG